MLSPSQAINWYESINSGSRQEYINALDHTEAAYYHLVRGLKKQSNITLPITTIGVNRIVPKIVSFVMPPGLNIRIKGLTADQTKFFKSKIRNIRKTVKSWVKRAVLDGTGVIHAYWEDSYEYIKDNVYFDANDEEIYRVTHNDRRLMQEYFLSTFQGSTNQWSFSNGNIKAMLPGDDGAFSPYTISFSTQPGEVVMAVLGDRLVYSGLKADVIPIRNLLFPIDAPNLDEADPIIIKQFLTPYQLSAFIDKDLLYRARGQQYGAQGIRSPAEASVTRTSEQPEHPPVSNAIEVWQVYWGSKISWVLPTVSHTFYETDLEDEFPRRRDLHRRPFFTIRYIDINDRMIYGWSMPMLLYHYQKEVDHLNNISNDAGDLATSLFGAYRSSGYALGEPKKIRLERNTLIPLEEPTKDIYFFNATPNIQWTIQKMFMLAQEIERLTQVDEMTLGRGSPTGAQRGEKTLGGLQLLMGQKQEIFMEMAWDMRQETDELLTALLFLYSRKASQAELKQADLFRNTLRSSSIYVDTDIAAHEQTVKRLTTLYQLLRDPLLIQLKITKPEGFALIAQKMIRLMDENPDLYISMPEMADPEEHINALEAGDVPVPSLMENHQQHMTKEYAMMGKAAPETRKNIMAHIQMHGMMMEQLSGAQNKEQTLGKYPGGQKQGGMI